MLSWVKNKINLGINYTNISTLPTNAATVENGLQSDIQYSTLQTIEDCPYARVVSVTEPLKGIFVPSDYTALNLKTPLDSSIPAVQQRLFFMIIGGPSSQAGVGRITITANWEGVPSKTTADWVTTTVTKYPASFNGRTIFDYIMQNNLVITSDDDESNSSKFRALIEGYTS